MDEFNQIYNKKTLQPHGHNEKHDTRTNSKQ